MTEQVLKPPLAVAKVCERQPDITLALVWGIVHRHQQSVCPWVVPGKSQEAIPGPVAVPGGYAFEQLPMAVAHYRMAEYGQQPVVKLFQMLVDGFVRASDQMGRDAFLSPLELPLVEEPQPRSQERSDGCGCMDSCGEGGGGPGLVVILQKAGQLVLVIEPGVEML